MYRVVVALWGIVVSAAGGYVTPVQAALEEEEPVKVEEVVVSATKTPTPVSHLTSSVEVISGEELSRKRMHTVFDGLRLAQGITAFQAGGPGNLATVQMRGTKSNHTMVLIDGVIVNSPTSGLFDFGG